MNHRITTRALTDSERKVLRRSKTSWFELILLPIIPGGAAIIAGILGYAVILWLLELVGVIINESIRWYGFVGVVLVGVLFGFYNAGSFFQYLKQARRREKASIKQAMVEMIAVENPVVVQQEEHNDEGPIYFLDIGDGKILYVCGQWMFEEQTYDPTPPRSDLDDEADDENWPPFPCESFVIHRAPESGAVLKIEIKGCKLNPSRTIKRKDVYWKGHYDSFVMEGSLDDLPGAVRRAEAKPKRRGQRTA